MKITETINEQLGREIDLCTTKMQILAIALFLWALVFFTALLAAIEWEQDNIRRFNAWAPVHGKMVYDSEDGAKEAWAAYRHLLLKQKYAKP